MFVFDFIFFYLQKSPQRYNIFFIYASAREHFLKKNIYICNFLIFDFQISIFCSTFAPKLAFYAPLTKKQR